VIGGIITITVTGTRFGELRRAAHQEHRELTRARE
jgi:hypothetical protein